MACCAGKKEGAPAREQPLGGARTQTTRLAEVGEAGEVPFFHLLHNGVRRVIADAVPADGGGEARNSRRDPSAQARLEASQALGGSGGQCHWLRSSTAPPSDSGGTPPSAPAAAGGRSAMLQEAGGRSGAARQQKVWSGSAWTASSTSWAVAVGAPAGEKRRHVGPGLSFRQKNFCGKGWCVALCCVAVRCVSGCVFFFLCARCGGWRGGESTKESAWGRRGVAARQRYAARASGGEGRRRDAAVGKNVRGVAARLAAARLALLLGGGLGALGESLLLRKSLLLFLLDLLLFDDLLLLRLLRRKGQGIKECH